ncbi:MAG: phytanoyl-CoA dioxygenase family protein [Porticoccaceae bacterium]|nr:phytanoyl-CoA dioxygenase family protein [Porticoccaceae bacterium]
MTHTNKTQTSENQTQSHVDEIHQQGYTVVRDAIAPELVAEIRDCLAGLEDEGKMPFSENNFEGFKTGRIFNLLNHSELFAQIPIHDNLLPIGEGMLDHGLLLSSISAIALHPGESAQPIHADTQLLNLVRPHVPISVTCMIAISDYTADNGATRIVPGSHLLKENPEYGGEFNNAISVEFSAGSALFLDSQLWHGGGANNSTEPRIGVVLAYCAGWTRPQENLLLGLPKEKAQRLPRRLQELLGYSIYKGQWGHIARQDPIEQLGSAPGKGMVWDASERKKSQGA